jgi:putative ABC transport system permease protein
MHADLRAAIRLLIRRPGFGLTIVLTLTVALGAFTAIFSLVNALMLRPLPFEGADRIVLVEAVIALRAE